MLHKKKLKYEDKVHIAKEYRETDMYRHRRREEGKSPTVEASIAVLDEAYQKYLHIHPIRAVIVDHGPQFYANKRDKNGHADHRFERYCRETAQVSKS